MGESQLVSKIYLFSYKCVSNKEWTDQCIQNKKSMLYDIKPIHDSLFLIKTTDDIELMENFMTECFDNKDSYFLVDITDQSNRKRNIESKNLYEWMDNI